MPPKKARGGRRNTKPRKASTATKQIVEVAEVAEAINVDQLEDPVDNTETIVLSDKVDTHDEGNGVQQEDRPLDLSHLTVPPPPVKGKSQDSPCSCSCSGATPRKKTKKKSPRQYRKTGLSADQEEELLEWLKQTPCMFNRRDRNSMNTKYKAYN